MNTVLAQITGSALMVASVVGTTAALYRRGRRGTGRLAVALAWIGPGIAGATTLLASLGRVVWIVGLVVACGALVCAAALGFVRSREVAAARRRDAALGEPRLRREPSIALTVSAAGLFSLILCAALIAPWMLVAASSAGIPIDRVMNGLLANLAVSTPPVWIASAGLATTRLRRRADDADALRRGVETRVADAEVRGYREGFATGRADGYRHAAFWTTWE